jgi:hypothetical protein
VFGDTSEMFGVRSEVYWRCHRQYPGDNGTPLEDNNGVSRSSTGITLFVLGGVSIKNSWLGQLESFITSSSHSCDPTWWW